MQCLDYLRYSQLVSTPEIYPASLEVTIAEMNSDSSIVADIPNTIDTSVTEGEAAGDVDQQTVSGIEKTTGLTPFLSSQSPFARCMPPEILAAIFLEYARDSASLWNSTIVPRWVAVSYVCQYWRDVALQCANLWGGHLFFVSSEWMDELLRRSKKAPLVVRIDLRRCSGLRVGPTNSLKKALQNMERIQDLWIDCPESMIEMIQPRLSVATPLLQSLHLSGCINLEGHHFVMKTDTLPGVMPSLRKVYLSSFHVDWSSPIFNRLVELTLGDLINQPMECWSGVLRILRQLPYLRLLRLDTIVPPNIDPIFPNSREQSECISLPHLEELALTGPISWTIALLTHLKFSKSTIIRLKCHCDDPQVISTLLALIPDQISNHPSMTRSAQTAFRYLDLNREEEGWELVYGPSATDAFGVDVLSSCLQSLDFQVILSRTIPEQTTQNDILVWFCAFPVAQLNTITVSHDEEYEFDKESLWTMAFQNAYALHTIEVDSSRFDSLIRALQPHDGVIPAPSLINISLCRIEFGFFCDLCEMYHTGVKMWSLLHALAKRAETGNMLPRLDLFQCSNITEDDAMELSKVVGQIEYPYTELGVKCEATSESEESQSECQCEDCLCY